MTEAQEKASELYLEYRNLIASNGVDIDGFEHHFIIALCLKSIEEIEKALIRANPALYPVQAHGRQFWNDVKKAIKDK